MPTVFSSSNNTSTSLSHASRSTTRGSSASVRHDSMGPLTSYAERPERVRFETQAEKEEVILFLRQHVIVNVPWLLLVFFLLIVPTFIAPLSIGNISLPITIPPSYIIIGTLAWYLGIFGFSLANFITWFFNIYIVTNERIVDIDFVYLLYKNFTVAELYRIQEISFVTGGIIETFFNYGNVIIQTAGEMPNLEFERVPYPERVVQVIRKQVEELRRPE